MVSIIIYLFSHCSNSIQLAFPIFLLVNNFLRLRPPDPASRFNLQGVTRAIFRACALVNRIRIRCTQLILSFLVFFKFTEFAVFSYLITVYFYRIKYNVIYWYCFVQNQCKQLFAMEKYEIDTFYVQRVQCVYKKKIIKKRA